MTTTTAPSTAAPTTAADPAVAEARLRTVLLVDGAGTTALGVAALLAAAPLSELVASPNWLRAVGVLLVVVGLDMLLAARLRGRRLALAGTVLAEIDFVWAAGTTLALVLLGASAAGAALVLGVAAVTVGMGTAKLVLARRLRA